MTPISVPIESLYSTSLHPISHSFRDMADYCSNFRRRQRTHSGWTPKFRTEKFGPKKLQTSLYSTVHILNRLGMDHECDRQTKDGRTDLTIASVGLQ